MPISSVSSRVTYPTELSRSIKPKHYGLFLFDIAMCDPWTYQGLVQIHLDINCTTRSIALNVQELVVSVAEVVAISKNARLVFKATKIDYDQKHQRCTLRFEQALPLAKDYSTVLHVSFKGTVNNQLTGFYRSSYEAPVESPGDEMQDQNEAPRSMLSTQFQPTYARRAFPCFDEPGLKATFDLIVEVPVGMTALSNMAKKDEQPGRTPDLKVVEFERTPMMSTYLLAWAIGDFEYIERVATRSGAPNYPVRLYTTKGLTRYGKFGLDVAIKALDLLSKMFRIEYPLSKLDLLTVHGMADDAMENWGLLTFQKTALLFDETSSDPAYLNHIAYIVAHELAHQWFGNLVTMEWWNELWLNEAFATWAGWYVVDLCYPEWNVWAQFVGESMQHAFHLDSLRTSHPVEASVVDALAVDSLFDDISYSKGSSLIRMLATHMGVDVFLRGVSEYLDKFAYVNTTAEHLWQALSKVSGLEVSVVMNPWTKSVGFPVIMVEDRDHQQLWLRQRRFLWDDFVNEEEDTTIWWTPLTPSLRAVHDNHPPKGQPLTAREAVYDIVDLESQIRPLNVDQAGFYRIDWSPSLLRRLQDGFPSLSVQEQIGLLGDIAASAAASQGSMTTGTLLSFMQNFRWQVDFHVWNALLCHLSDIQSIFSSDAEVARGLNKFTLDLTSNAMTRVGWHLRITSPSTHLTARLRGLLVSVTGLSGHESLVAEVLRQFRGYLDVNETGTNPSLRRAVLSIAVSSGGPQIFETMKTAYMETEFIDGEEVILNCLGQVPTPELAREYLEWAFDGNVETEELACVIGGLAENSNVAVREVMWQFIKEQWSRVESLYAGSLGIFEPLLQQSLETLVSPEIGDDVKSFFKHKETAEFAQGLAVGVESIAWRASYLERDLDVVRDWLRTGGFTSEVK